MVNLLEKLEIGSLLDHYRVEENVSRAKTHSVYRAVDTRTNRTVALKIPTALAEADSLFSERLRREAEIGARLDHPSILKVYADEHRSHEYLVLEWVQGQTLRSELDAGPLERERAIRLMTALLDALTYIHVNGVYHRDLRPENILVCAGDRIKVVGFGLAGNVAARRLTYTNLAAELTAPYLSPEQAQGKRGDARSDIYAAGVIFYEMLTGKSPFPGSDAMAVMQARLAGPPIPPRVADPTVTPQLQEALYRALERDPHKRYFSAWEFQNDLENLDQVGVSRREEEEQWRKARSPLRRRTLILFLLILLPVALCALAFFLK